MYKNVSNRDQKLIFKIIEWYYPEVLKLKMMKVAIFIKISEL